VVVWQSKAIRIKIVIAAKSKGQQKFRRQFAPAFFPAPEVRQKVAHGATLVITHKFSVLVLAN
jgi:hypothetical protein